MKPHEIQEKIDALKADYRETLYKVASLCLKEATAPLFINFPDLDSFGFIGYTPYFNDGEECEYRIRDEYFINGFNEYSDEEEHSYFAAREGDRNIWGDIQYNWATKKYNGPKEDVALIQAVGEFIKSFGSDLWKDLIGDHAIIRITRDGLEVKHYDHE